ncbi:hypothetical protein bcgnr5372_34080 [Bacillus luti]|nr:hypothetical protein [Bacillus cereus]HDR8329580.1 hypothetical protein [Bacillus cereus]HDR8332909.1 hypothetical protein [Bacillus cereus]
MIRDSFVPGQWLDIVDVNDFVNLNRKPFFETPLFLQSPVSLLDWSSLSPNKSVTYRLSYSTWQDSKIEWLHNQPLDYTTVKIGKGESLSLMKQYPHVIPARVTSSDISIPELLKSISVLDNKKLNEFKTLTHNGMHYTLSSWFPDIRMVPLYGTRFLIKEKKLNKQLTDMQFQSHDWVDERLQLEESIRVLKRFEKFAKRHHIDVTNAAQNTKTMLDMLFITLLALYTENPSILLSISDVTTFIDIYAEAELDEGLINEETIQQFVEEFWFRISVLRFSTPPKLNERTQGIIFPIGETIDTRFPTKTTYRFLHAINRFQLNWIPIRVLWYDEAPKPLCENIMTLAKVVPITFVNGQQLPIQSNAAFHPFFLVQQQGSEICVDGGILDVQELFYLALNGGRDYKGNYSIFPATQPTRTQLLSYEEALEKWKEMLVYISTFWVEHTNTASYVSYTKHSHPLRFALYERMKQMVTWFGFSNMRSLAQMLSSLYRKDAEISFDKQGLITEISKGDIEDDVMDLICRIIEEEISKLPLYRHGISRIRFFEENPDTPIKPSVNFPSILPYGLGCVTVNGDPEVIHDCFEQGYAIVCVSHDDFRNIGGCTVLTTKS